MTAFEEYAPRAIELGHGERIIAVVPQMASGPGWSNQPTWVYIETPGGKLRSECIQPGEQTRKLEALFRAGAAMCESLLAAVPTKRSNP